MAEVKKIATRQSYGEALKELGKLHDNVVVLDADLANATKTDIFKKSISRPAFRLRHRRGGYDLRGGGAVHRGLRALRLQLRHVRGGPRL